MNGFAAYDSCDFFTFASENGDPLTKQDLVPPAADGDEFDEAIVSDVLHHEADFVHVAGNEDSWAFIRIDANYRAGAVSGERAEFGEFIGENGPDFVFVAGNGVCFAEFFE